MGKLKNRYEIRYYQSSTSFSKHVGFKFQLVEFTRAVRIVNRLKKSGVDAFYSKLQIRA